MRRLAWALLATVLLVPLAGAQTITNPINGGWDEVYVVAGRVVDQVGNPVAGANLVVELSQPGIRAEPLAAKTNCFGDFITAFDLRNVLPSGKAVVTVRGLSPDQPQTRAEAAFDPFYRRSDMLITYEGTWGAICPKDSDLWPGRVSVTGRIVNRTEPWEREEGTYDARPYSGLVRLALVKPDGTRYCPPSQAEGQCESIVVDERGDFRYSWTFPESIEPRGVVELHMGDRVWNASIDPVHRIAVHRVELSGQGAPEIRESPLPGAPAALGALAVAGLLARRLLPPRSG